MTNKNDLNQKQLDKVSGGFSINAEGEKKYRDEYTIEIDQYDTVNYIGQNLYFSYYNKLPKGNGIRYIHNWIYGTLLDSYEKSFECGTKRTGKVQVIESGGDDPEHGLTEIYLDTWKTYKK